MSIIAHLLAAMGTPRVVGLLCGIVTCIWFVMAWLFVKFE